MSGAQAGGLSRGTTRAGWKRLMCLAAVLLAPLVLALTLSWAWAYWSAGSIPGGNGAAAAATVGAGATPTASAAGSAVTVSWAASALSSGQPVDGYIVTRYDVSTLTAQAMLSACGGIVTPTACTETSVPTGQWVYSVTPVLASNWRGAESPKSNPVTTDTTPPVNSISMSVATGNAAKSGETIFYRGAAAGSFTLSNVVSDSGSGPASSETESLTGTSTGWSHTPSTVSTPSGGPYVSNPYSWTAGSASAPTAVVAGRDVAGNRALSTLTFVDDSTAPTPGTITYADGYQAGRSVTIGFSGSTDTGSGVAAVQLQRSQAPLSAGGCGPFGVFVNLGPANPATPYVDSQVSNGLCYRYRLVVTDRLGNQGFGTSANVARVDYAGAIATTSGVLSHWRLGENAASLVSFDSFTGATSTLLTTRSGEIGATWAYQTGCPADMRLSTENRLRRSFFTTNCSIAYTSSTPPSPDYSVEADLFVKSTLTGDRAGVIGRLNTGTNAFYMARWERDTTSWNIYYVSNSSSGSQTRLNRVIWPSTLTVGETYRVRLTMTGTQLGLFVNGVLTASATHSTLSAAGRAGVMHGDFGSAPSMNDDTGLHFDNFQVTPATYPRAADSVGSNTADYLNGVSFGVPGALAGDANTGASFDGANDLVQAVDTTGIPVGSALRSVEMWFKTTSAARQVLFSYGMPANTQEFGLWLNAGGTSMTAWGSGSGNDNSFTVPAPVNDGSWHHVVKTYDGASIRLYIDGLALAAQPATRATVIDSYGFGIGAVISPRDPAAAGGFFSGSLDEVSFYTTALNQATVTNHYALGTSPAADVSGPTGGSVDAAGLVGTGARYAASTTLSLVLAKGTDPSGLAATGAQLLRATATLASAEGTVDGVCGAFGSYTLIAGGTDPASPKSDTVTDHACYRYQYVVADTVGNTTPYTSPDIKVDTTPPSTPTLAFSAFSNTYWSGGASTQVFYRSGASAGAVTATAVATDTSSGIAGFAFPALGANWISTPGTLGVNTFSWSGVPAAPGTSGVSATNHATRTSASSPFTLTPDDTPPAVGTVTYADGTIRTTTVAVTFTTGTDGASGVGVRLLQRASAPLTGTTCGTYGAFSTVTNGTNPTSPFIDTVSGWTCYQYRYVVADNVGNQATAVSSNVVKVLPTYVAAVNSTAGLVNYWRLGETTWSADSFTGATGAELSTRTGEIGATWTRWVNDTITGVLTNEGRLRKDNLSGGVSYYASSLPNSADYTVEADLHVKSMPGTDYIGIMGRVDLNNTTGLGTHYALRYNTNSNRWELLKRVGGTTTTLATYGQDLNSGTTYRMGLAMQGTTMSMVIDGVVRASATDTSISNAGRAGVRLGAPGVTATQNNTQGLHLDNFRVTARLVDSTMAQNHGIYVNGPTLGVTGAIANDPDTAMWLGGSGYGRASRQISDDLSIEFWFNSTQGIGTSPEWRDGAALVDADVMGITDDFGISLRSDGVIVAGTGDPNISIQSAPGYNNGVWHHVVFTRAMSSGALRLFVDGQPRASGTTSNRGRLTAPTDLSFGRNASGNQLVGFLDEIAVYNVALSDSMVLAHFDAAQ